jgi:hypothetical protein
MQNAIAGERSRARGPQDARLDNWNPGKRSWQVETSLVCPSFGEFQEKGTRWCPVRSMQTKVGYRKKQGRQAGRGVDGVNDVMRWDLANFGRS